MKRLTLDETWTRCLEMWRWIVKEETKHPGALILDLKRLYILTFRLDDDMPTDCYFCEYKEQQGLDLPCQSCPGAKIDPAFRCNNPSYHYLTNAVAFLHKLQELNANRLAMKKAKPARRSRLRTPVSNRRPPRKRVSDVRSQTRI